VAERLLRRSQTVTTMVMIPGASAPPQLVVLYLSPDQMLPLTSVLGGAIGFVLLVGRRAVDFLRSTWSGLRGRRASGAAAASPHDGR